MSNFKRDPPTLPCNVPCHVKWPRLPLARYLVPMLRGTRLSLPHSVLLKGCGSLQGIY